MVQPELQNFEYTTEWLPRGDFYTLGHPLFDGWLTWSSHSSAGYAILHQAAPPTDPNDLFTPISYFPGVQGADLMTRHEIDAPFNLGPVKVVPFAMGEVAYWGEGFDGQPINRLPSARASTARWKCRARFPKSKATFWASTEWRTRSCLEAGYRYTNTSLSLSDIPQYNEFDDNAQERFRERLIVNTYGGLLPLAVDPAHLRAAFGGRVRCDLAVQRVDRRPGSGAARPSSTVADEVRTAGQPADPRLDDARSRSVVLPRSGTRQFRRSVGTAHGALCVEHEPADLDSRQRHLRLLPQRSADVERGRLEPAKRARQRLPRTASRSRPTAAYSTATSSRPATATR